MNTARILLLTVSLSVLLSCGASPVGTDPSGPSFNVAVCALQTYEVTTDVIGPAGGRLRVGKHRFDIPAGALAAPVQITMEAVADSVNGVRFSPDGLTFDPAHLPKLKLSSKGCTVPHGSKQKVAHVSETLHIIQLLPSTSDTLNGTTDADLPHFSRYAVAW